MNGAEVAVLIPLGFFAAVAWSINVIVSSRRQQRQIQLSTEFHSRLLDRIGSAKEFGEFLNTEGGGKFLRSLTVETEGLPHTRIIRALQAGLVLVSLGLGLFLLTSSRSLVHPTEEGLVVFATITLSVGVGLLLSSAASYLLSKRMGLLDVDRQRGRSALA